MLTKHQNQRLGRAPAHLKMKVSIGNNEPENLLTRHGRNQKERWSAHRFPRRCKKRPSMSGSSRYYSPGGELLAAPRGLNEDPRRKSRFRWIAIQVKALVRLSNSDSGLSFRGPQSDGLVGKVMIGFDHSHRPAASAHKDGVSYCSMSPHTHAP
jgi:hypothetical protein